MASPSQKYEQNVPGWFYVDKQCIDCDVCQETAPENFGRNADGGHAYVIKQPSNEEEAELCVEAIAACPVESIGDDGAG